MSSPTTSVETSPPLPNPLRSHSGRWYSTLQRLGQHSATYLVRTGWDSSKIPWFQLTSRNLAILDLSIQVIVAMSVTLQRCV